MNDKLVWTYWTGPKPDLIQKLEDKMVHNSNGGKNYKLIQLTDNNLADYMEIPVWFDRLKPAHKADYIRVKMLRIHGGIWLDADTLVLNNMSCLFKHLQRKKGFFLIENGINLCNGVFGSIKETPLMIEWEKRIEQVLKKKVEMSTDSTKELPLYWVELGGTIMRDMGKDNINLYDGYKIIEGADKYYRISGRLAEKFFEKNDELYDEIVKNDDIVIIINLVYRMWEVLKDREFLNETLIGRLLYTDTTKSNCEL